MFATGGIYLISVIHMTGFLFIQRAFVTAIKGCVIR